METHKCNSLTYITIIRTRFYKCFQLVWDWRNIFFIEQRNNHENYLSSLEGCSWRPLAPTVLGQRHRSSRHGTSAAAERFGGSSGLSLVQQCRRAAVGTVAYPPEPKMSFIIRAAKGNCVLWTVILQHAASVFCCGSLPCGWSIWKRRSSQSTGAPKSVPVISKGSAEMLQVSIWNQPASRGSFFLTLGVLWALENCIRCA